MYSEVLHRSHNDFCARYATVWLNIAVDEVVWEIFNNNTSEMQVWYLTSTSIEAELGTNVKIQDYKIIYLKNRE